MRYGEIWWHSGRLEGQIWWHFVTIRKVLKYSEIWWDSVRFGAIQCNLMRYGEIQWEWVHLVRYHEILWYLVDLINYVEIRWDLVLGQIGQSWVIVSPKLCQAVRGQIRHSWLNQSVLNHIRWFILKSGGPESNQVVLIQIRWSWVKSGWSNVISGGSESNRAVLSQISWSWIKSVSLESNE